MNTKTLLMSFSMIASAACAQNLTSGIDKANMNLNVKPGDDFYEYAAGGWLKAHPLDAEHPSNGAFVDLEEQNQKRIRGLIEEYSSVSQPKGTLGQKIGDLYNMLMDSVRLNREGAAPLMPVLEKIRAIKNKKEYQLVTARLDRQGVGAMMFGIGVGADQRNASQNIVGISQGGIGLGDRDYYLNDDEQTVKVREAYKEYIATLFRLAGDDSQTAQKKTDVLLAIETRIAKASYDKVKLRDINANYHKMSYASLIADYPGIDWGNIFLAQGFPPFDEVDLGQPEPVKEVERILEDTSLDDLKTYAEAKALGGAISLLGDDFRNAYFKFSQVLTGVKEDRPRWKRAVSIVSDVMGEAIGKLYVEKYFPESSKQRMLSLVHNLQTALAERIDEASWMEQATKEQAKDKLNNFIIKIVYYLTVKDSLFFGFNLLYPAFDFNGVFF